MAQKLLRGRAQTFLGLREDDRVLSETSGEVPVR